MSHLFRLQWQFNWVTLRAFATCPVAGDFKESREEIETQSEIQREADSEWNSKRLRRPLSLTKSLSAHLSQLQIGLAPGQQKDVQILCESVAVLCRTVQSVLLRGHFQSLILSALLPLCLSDFPSQLMTCALVWSLKKWFKASESSADWSDRRMSRENTATSDFREISKMSLDQNSKP